MSRDLDALAKAVEETRVGGRPTPSQQRRHAEALLEFARGLQHEQYFEDGAGASAEALRIFSDRVEAGEEQLSPKLAASLLVHANCLHGLGVERAVDVFESAARLYGALAHREPQRYLERLAGVSNDLGCCLREQGRAANALFHAEKAVEMFGLVVAEDGATLHHLAGAKLNLAKVYSMLGRHDDAIASAREGVEMFEALANSLPHHFALTHAEALDDLSILSSAAGHTDEALELAERAAKLVADLAREEPARYLEALARVANNLGRRYAEAGRLEDSVGWLQKAVAGFDLLARRHREAFLEPSVRVRGNLVQALEELGRQAEAFEVTTETLGLARALGPGLTLALMLRKHADLADGLGRSKEALESSCDALRSIVPVWREDREGLDKWVRSLAMTLVERAERDGELADDVNELIEEVAG